MLDLLPEKVKLCSIGLNSGLIPDACTGLLLSLLWPGFMENRALLDRMEKEKNIYIKGENIYI